MGSNTYDWSGPGRALSTHLKLFEDSHREYLTVWGGQQNKSRHTPGTSLPRFMSWLRFAETYSRQAVGVSADGQVVDGGQRFVDPVLMDGRTNAEWSPDDFDPTQQSIVDTASLMWRAEHEMLDAGTTYYISTEMSGLVTEAAELAEPEPIFSTDLPTQSGLLVFERPLILPDLHPVTGDSLADVMPIRAIGWKVTEVGVQGVGIEAKNGLVLFCYADMQGYIDLYQPRMAELTGKPQSEVDPMYRAMEVIPVEFHPWAFGRDWSAVESFGEVEPGKIISSVAYGRRWFLSFTRLMWQRLLQPETWHPDRAGRRRFERVRGKEVPEASVLHLRRFDDQKVYRQKEDPEAWLRWPYNYRIMVLPHWKRQYFPKLGPARLEDGSFNPASHRLIYIVSYARGPEHLPIQLQHKIMAVIR